MRQVLRTCILGGLILLSSCASPAPVSRDSPDALEPGHRYSCVGTVAYRELRGQPGVFSVSAQFVVFEQAQRIAPLEGPDACRFVGSEESSPQPRSVSVGAGTLTLYRQNRVVVSLEPSQTSYFRVLEAPLAGESVSLSGNAQGFPAFAGVRWAGGTEFAPILSGLTAPALGVVSELRWTAAGTPARVLLMGQRSSLSAQSLPLEPQTFVCSGADDGQFRFPSGFCPELEGRTAWLVSATRLTRRGYARGDAALLMQRAQTVLWNR